jgi:hypothetical protein
MKMKKGITILTILAVFIVLVTTAFAVNAAAEDKFKVSIGVSHEQFFKSPYFLGAPESEKWASLASMPNPNPYIRYFYNADRKHRADNDASPSFSVKGLYRIWTPSPIYAGLGFGHSQHEGSSSSVSLRYGYDTQCSFFHVKYERNESYGIERYSILFPVEGSIALFDWLSVGAGIEASANYYQISLKSLESVTYESKYPDSMKMYPRPIPPELYGYRESFGAWRFGLGGSLFLDARIYKSLHIKAEGGATKIFGDITRTLSPSSRFEADMSTWNVGGEAYITF